MVSSCELLNTSAEVQMVYWSQCKSEERVRHDDKVCFELSLADTVKGIGHRYNRRRLKLCQGIVQIRLVHLSTKVSGKLGCSGRLFNKAEPFAAGEVVPFEVAKLSYKQA